MAMRILSAVILVALLLMAGCGNNITSNTNALSSSNTGTSTTHPEKHDVTVAQSAGPYGSFTSITGFGGYMAFDNEGGLWGNVSASEVRHVDKNGVEKETLGGTDEKGAPKAFQNIDGIAVDNDRHRVYISYSKQQEIWAFDVNESVLFKIPEAGTPVPVDPSVGFKPKGLAVYRDRIYATSEDGLYVFDSEGNFKDHWGSKGDVGKPIVFGDANQFFDPTGVAVDQSNGNIYVTYAYRVMGLTPNAHVRWIIGAPKVPSYIKTEFDETFAGAVIKLPQNVSLDANGNIFVDSSFPGAEKIYVLDNNGKLLSVLGDGGQFKYVHSLTISSSGQMAIQESDVSYIDSQSQVPKVTKVWQEGVDLPPAENKLVSAFASALYTN